MHRIGRRSASGPGGCEVARWGGLAGWAVEANARVLRIHRLVVDDGGCTEGKSLHILYNDPFLMAGRDIRHDIESTHI